MKLQQQKPAVLHCKYEKQKSELYSFPYEKPVLKSQMETANTQRIHASVFKTRPRKDSLSGHEKVKSTKGHERSLWHGYLHVQQINSTLLSFTKHRSPPDHCTQLYRATAAPDLRSLTASLILPKQNSYTKSKAAAPRMNVDMSSTLIFSQPLTPHLILC